MSHPRFTEECEIILPPDADRLKWLEARRQGIGASEAAKVCGVSRWEGPLAVWREKVSTTPVKDEPPSEAAEWGHHLEPVVASVYAKRKGLQISQVGLLRSFQHPWMLGTPDYQVIGEPEFLEIKTTSRNLYKDWANGQVPDDAEVQSQHLMAVSGYEGVHVVVLIDGQTLRWRYLPRDEEMIALIREKEEKFWNHNVLAHKAPDPTHLDGDTLLGLHPTATTGAVRELPLEAYHLIQEYRDEQQLYKGAEKRKKEIVNQLKAWMGDAEIGTLNGQKVFSWKRTEKTEFNKEEFISDHPKLFQQYTSTAPSDSFYIGKGND